VTDYDYLDGQRSPFNNLLNHSWSLGSLELIIADTFNRLNIS
jgi:hypothetical protein